MRTLLIHALRSEAAIIRQYYPQATAPACDLGIELRTLDPNLDLLRTGLGLTKTTNALSQLPDPGEYGQIIHFGVSGSLAEQLPVYSLIQGRTFLSPDKLDILPACTVLNLGEQLQSAVFVSVAGPIQDEHEREQLMALGAQAVDMESYAVAEFFQPFGTPLLALRCISDRAGASTAHDFKTHYTQAAARLQHFLLQQILRTWDQ